MTYFLKDDVSVCSKNVDLTFFKKNVSHLIFKFLKEQVHLR